MGEKTYTNRALKIFFLSSIFFHLIFLFFLGRGIRSQKKDFRIVVDIKTNTSKKPLKNIPSPPTHSNDIHQPQAIRTQIFSMKNFVFLQSKIPKTNTGEYSIPCGKAEITPEPMSYEMASVQMALKSVQKIPLPQLPLNLTTTSSDSDQLKTYLTQIYNRIEKIREYPFAAQRQGLEGKVKLEFLLYKDGTVGDIRIIESSQYSMLNKAAIENVRAGDPYPPFPSGIKENSIWVNVPIVFSLIKKSHME